MDIVFLQYPAWPPPHYIDIFTFVEFVIFECKLSLLVVLQGESTLKGKQMKSQSGDSFYQKNQKDKKQSLEVRGQNTKT